MISGGSKDSPSRVMHKADSDRRRTPHRFWCSELKSESEASSSAANMDTNSTMSSPPEIPFAEIASSVNALLGTKYLAGELLSSLRCLLPHLTS